MKTFGPYSPIVKAGDLYFISGQVGVDPQTGDAALDVAAQTSQALTNMKEVLRQYDLDTDNVIKTTIFVTDMEDFKTVNEIYQKFFVEPRPARSTVAVKELPRVAKQTLLVEIEAIASVYKRNGVQK